MDPFTTTLYTIGAGISALVNKETLIAGIAGNRADAIFCKYMDQILHRIRKSNSKTNHDIQKAIRKAQLESVLGVCGVLLVKHGHGSDELLHKVWKKIKTV